MGGDQNVSEEVQTNEDSLLLSSIGGTKVRYFPRVIMRGCVRVDVPIPISSIHHQQLTTDTHQRRCLFHSAPLLNKSSGLLDIYIEREP